MSKPKTYPPYRIEGEGDDAWIVDSAGNDVVDLIGLSNHYFDAFPNIMKILCDALNEYDRKEDQ